MTRKIAFRLESIRKCHSNVQSYGCAQQGVYLKSERLMGQVIAI